MRLILLGILLLTGCTTSEAGSGVRGVTTAGVAAGLASINPFLGLMVGIATSVGIDQGLKYGERSIQGNVQDAIAEAAGPLNIGQSASWQVAEMLPFTERAGTVEVVRLFGETFPCKDVVFTVQELEDLFLATICRNGDRPWRWAAAEPSIHRWDGIQ
jgi:hypothetical protein